MNLYSMTVVPHTNSSCQESLGWKNIFIVKHAEDCVDGRISTTEYRPSPSHLGGYAECSCGSKDFRYLKGIHESRISAANFDKYLEAEFGEQCQSK